MTIAEIKDSIIESLTVELESDPDFSEDILSEKVDNAVNDVIRARRYARAGYSQERIEADLEEYLSIIRSIALYDYNTVGMDFQTSHQENGIQRSFVNRRYLFNGIIPLAQTV